MLEIVDIINRMGMLVCMFRTVFMSFFLKSSIFLFSDCLCFLETKVRQKRNKLIDVIVIAVFRGDGSFFCIEEMMARMYADIWFV